MEPFTWVGMGAALMFAFQLVTGRIDLGDSAHADSPQEPDPRSDLPPGMAARRNGQPPDPSPGFPPVPDADQEPAGATVRRHTRLFTDDEYGDAAADLRDARRD